MVRKDEEKRLALKVTGKKKYARNKSRRTRRVKKVAEITTENAAPCPTKLKTKIRKKKRSIGRRGRKEKTETEEKQEVTVVGKSKTKKMKRKIKKKKKKIKKKRLQGGRVNRESTEAAGDQSKGENGSVAHTDLLQSSQDPTGDESESKHVPLENAVQDRRTPASLSALF